MLRKAIESESLARQLEAMPWGVGSGFVTSDRAPGFVFCARILDRADEPSFRYVPLPPSLVPVTGQDPAQANSEAIAAAAVEGPNIAGTRVDIVTDTLTSLTMAGPPDSRTPAYLPEQWRDLAYKAWSAAQGQIADEWNENLDVLGQAGPVAPAVREAVRHLHLHGTHRNQQDIDLAIKVFSRGQAARVTSIVRSVMRDDDLTDRTRTDRLIELVDELGLSAPESRPKRFPIEPTDVHLIAWMAIIPPDIPVDWAGEMFADETQLL